MLRQCQKCRCLLRGSASIDADRLDLDGGYRRRRPVKCGTSGRGETNSSDCAGPSRCAGHVARSNHRGAHG
jgi:hypothetical protein